MPLVSVIIPTHDRQPLVCEAVGSVLEQRDAAFEVIVVDDGSTDGTAAALDQEFGGSIRVIRQTQRGISAARNRGVSAARGEWIAFLDSDDLWRPGKLRAQVEFHAGHPDVLVSQTEEIWVRNGVRVNSRKVHEKRSGDIFLCSLERCLVSPSAVMIRRDLFEGMGGFDESLTVCEDYDLWLRLAARVEFGLVPGPFVIKRGGHADQLSRRYWGMDRFRVAALMKLLVSVELTVDRRHAVVDTLLRKCAILAAGARQRGRSGEAERYLELARVGTTLGGDCAVQATNDAGQTFATSSR